METFKSRLTSCQNRPQTFGASRVPGHHWTSFQPEAELTKNSRWCGQKRWSIVILGWGQPCRIFVGWQGVVTSSFATLLSIRCNGCCYLRPFLTFRGVARSDCLCAYCGGGCGILHRGGFPIPSHAAWIQSAVRQTPGYFSEQKANKR